VRAAGHQLRVAVAVHNGELIGFTEAAVGEAGEGGQHDTSVRRDWCGRGLGTNAANAPMLAVCARLGFRETHRRPLVSAPVAR
jgi:hypothetical protein